MASDKEYLEFISEQLSDLEEVSFRAMMGEYIIYYNQRIAAYICDDRLLVKPVPSAEAMLSDAPHEPPYDGAKNMILVENIEDKGFLTELFKAMYDELAIPKKKSRKK